MKPILTTLAAFLLTSTCPQAAPPAPATPAAVVPAKHTALLKTYCVSCHGAEKQKGKFRVDDLAFGIATIESAEKWQKILNALNAGEMPPDDAKQPPVAAKTDFLDDLSNVMVAARRGLADQRGTITMRRLNRREYANTLRELLGVEINVAELPADTATGVFDTGGSNLFMSGNQFEQYMALGREALEEAFEWQAAAGSEHKFRMEGEETTTRIRKWWAAEMETRERGLKWVAAVMDAAARPENAAVVAELRKTANTDQLLRRSWQKIQGAPSPESFGFNTVENNADKANRAAGNAYFHPYYQKYLELPALDRGGYLTIHSQDLNEVMGFLIPFKWPVGDYVVRVRIGATEKATPERRFFEFGIHPRHGQVMSTHHVTGTMAAPQTVEIPLTLTRGHRDRDNRTIFIREKGTNDHIDQKRAKFNAGMKENGVGPEFALWVDWIEIERKPHSGRENARGIAALGIPLDDKSPELPALELRAALGRFATEAFRGIAPTPEYVDKVASLYGSRRKGGDKHSAALKHALAVILSSPAFLYLAEPVPDAKRRPLTGDELASRLSYFLWGAPPDATLRDLARRGELAKPAVLAMQTTRLIEDPRARDFLRPFVHQWLNLDRLDFFEFNRALHPRFDDATKLASRNEVYETLAHLLRENASMRDLLKSDYVVIDAVLADYYGLPGVSGDGYRKVTLPPGSPRGGLLGMAAILAMGGNGQETSPVERGAWVLRKLMNDPPPPAPANVPQLARLAGKVLTTRERLLAHQEEPQCASCHRKIDPIGFGLENFDAAGLWRTEDFYQLKDETGKPVKGAKKTWSIDPAAAFHRGPAFRDFFAMRDIVASQPDRFARGFSLALVEYALGRPCGFSDEPLIEEMTSRAREKNYAMREFIHTLVASRAFQTK